MSKKLALVGAAACAACCAPLALPLIAPSLAATGILGASGAWALGASRDLIVCGGLALVAALGLGLWLRRRRMTEGVTCDLDHCGPAQDPGR